MNIPSIKSFLDRVHRPVLRWILPGVLLAAHGLAAWHVSRRLSPPWDEVVYPAAGYALWKTKDLTLHLQQPPLPGLIYALPLLPLNLNRPFAGAAWKNKEPFRFGFEFLYRNAADPLALIRRFRRPALFLSLGTACLIFFLARDLSGPAGGLIALACYATTPAFVSRAGLALLEMPLFFFTAAALFFYGRWLRGNRPVFLGLAATASGLALGCKLTAALLPAALILFELVAHPGRGGWPARLGRCLLLALVPAAVLAGLYLPWPGGLQGLLETARFGQRFARHGIPYFFAGRTYVDPPSLLSWAAFFIKTSPFLLAIAAMGALSWRRCGGDPASLRLLLIFSAVVLSVPAWVDRPLSTIQLSLIYLPLALLASGAARAGAGRWSRGVAAACLLFMAGEAWAVRSNPLAYISPLFGGPAQGHHWLSDSDQDWGQALPGLADFLRQQGNPPLVLAYAGAADPEAHGVRYQDLLSPALVSAARHDALWPVESERMFLAVGTKLFQSQPRLFGWLLDNRRPLARIDHCFFVYDLSRDAEAFLWMEEIYGVLGFSDKAAWARQRAALLKNSEGAKP